MIEMFICTASSIGYGFFLSESICDDQCGYESLGKILGYLLLWSVVTTIIGVPLSYYLGRSFRWETESEIRDSIDKILQKIANSNDEDLAKMAKSMLSNPEAKEPIVLNI